jgi:hypothetical protein
MGHTLKRCHPPIGVFGNESQIKLLTTAAMFLFAANPSAILCGVLAGLSAKTEFCAGCKYNPHPWADLDPSLA